jgi:hypothetical protein
MSRGKVTTKTQRLFMMADSIDFGAKPQNAIVLLITAAKIQITENKKGTAQRTIPHL